MKSVLISIQPKWVEKIASGEKTIEVRKTKPKIDTPFKCYIYATKTGERLVLESDKVFEISKSITGKVIGEFVCDKIGTLVYDDTTFRYPYYYGFGSLGGTAKMCLSHDELMKYGKGKTLYGWHISNLVIYDKPKELSEFYKLKKCNSCKVSGYESSACIFDEDCKVPVQIKRPPQSWCYVEEL